MSTRCSARRPPYVAVVALLLAEATRKANANPIGNTDKNSNLHCSPPHWYNILFFFVTNYAIHAATVISLPGESGYTSAAYKTCCLLVPFAGIRRGLNVFLRASALAENALHAAARANALCMVVRSKTWRPSVGDVLEGCRMDIARPDGETDIELESLDNNSSVSRGPVVTKSLEDKDIKTLAETGKIQSIGGSSMGGETLAESLHSESREVSWDVRAPYSHRAPTTRLGKVFAFLLHSYRFRAMPLEHQVVPREDIEVHGVCRLPPGYALCFIPPHMDVRPRGDVQKTDEVKVASQFNALQILWSLAQTMMGSWTLWQARGSQLNRYGYAAFGLTVIPYVIASVINLLGSLVSRQYDDVYLVHSEIMDEAVGRGGVVDGVVGTVSPRRPGCGVRDDCDEERFEGDDERGILGEAIFDFRDDPDHDGSLQCWRVDAPSRDSSEILLTLPPPKPTLPTAGPGRQRWAVAGWCPRFISSLKSVYRQPASTPRPSKSKRKHKTKSPNAQPQYTISIPCHGPFRRLPAARFEPVFKALASILLILSIAGPYLIIYALTGWKPMQATTTQGNMTVHWLVLGQIYGLIVAEFERHTGKGAWGTILLVTLVLYGWAAVGGIAIVVQEMIEFGTCETW